MTSVSLKHRMQKATHLLTVKSISRHLH